MIIKRDRYLNQLIKKQHNGMIKIVTGLRRSGKSYLLFTLFYNYLLETGVERDHIITLSLEEEVNSAYRDIDKLREYILSFVKDDGYYYILLDEVQFTISQDEIKGKSYIRLYGLLNELIKNEKFDVYITGSNSRFLSSDIQTEFRGRGDEIRVYPLSFYEYFSVSNKDKYEAFNEYMMFGGLPYIATKTDYNEKAEYLKKQIKSTYLLDILERYNLKDDQVLDGLLNILSSSVGSLTNPNKLVNSFNSKGIKTNAVTVKNYLNYFEDSFLIKSAFRYNIKGNSYISTPLKYYFSDIGLRNAQINFRQQDIGHVIENIIFNELISRGYDVDVGVVPVQVSENGKRTLKNYEVDFICNAFNHKFYIQSASSINDQDKMKQETQSFRNIDDSFEKIIITKENTLPFVDDYGYKIINIIDFLLNEDSTK